VSLIHKDTFALSSKYFPKLIELLFFEETKVETKNTRINYRAIPMCNMARDSNFQESHLNDILMVRWDSEILKLRGQLSMDEERREKTYNKADTTKDEINETLALYHILYKNINEAPLKY